MMDKERCSAIARNLNKIAIPNVLIVIGLLIPLSLFHEVGHILVCVSYGYHFGFFFDGMNFNALVLMLQILFGCLHLWGEYLVP